MRKKRISRRKRELRRRRRILFSLLVLLILLVVLVRGELMGGSGTDVASGVRKQLEELLGATGGDEDPRWSYVSRYESDPPVLRTEDEIQQRISELAMKYPEFQEIYQNRKSYSEALLAALCNNPDMFEFVRGYREQQEQAGNFQPGDLELSKEDMVGDVPLLIQWDARWGYYAYGDDDIALSGCAPTCLAMVAAGLNRDESITPIKVAQFATDNNYHLPGTGTQWSIMTEGCAHFGLEGKVISLDKDVVYSELRRGRPIICSVGPGDFTTAGHFIVLAGIKDDKIIVNDPNSKVRSARLWEFDELAGQIKNLWSFRRA